MMGDDQSDSAFSADILVVASLLRTLRCVSGITSELNRARRVGDSRLTNLSHGLSADGIALP
jgi:hypothetical protein